MRRLKRVEVDDLFINLHHMILVQTANSSFNAGIAQDIVIKCRFLSPEFDYPEVKTENYQNLNM